MNTVILRRELKDTELIVVKIGSKILTPGPAGTEHLQRIAGHIDDMCRLASQECSVVFVSSGAVSHGKLKLGLQRRPKTIPMKQACAGVGQIELLNIYNRMFSRSGRVCGQILLTWDDLGDKKRYNNLRNTLFTMLDNGIVPILNENDSVGVEEITFGDNDTLAAQIATILNADLFITLTDINGLYTANPQNDPAAKHVSHVPVVTDEIRCMADAEGNDVGTGGMITKLKAAEMVTNAGIAAIIGNGYDYSLIDVINTVDAGTLFTPLPRRMKAKQRFLAFTDTSTGCIYVDDGAFRAISAKGKSLLPAGILRISDEISPGDTVDIYHGSRLFARGISNYGSPALKRIKGHKTAEINPILGGENYNEVVHRNNMVVLQA
ncbi:MAG: glutamate 5-kinase [Fibrobacterota bacterium]